MSRATCDEQPLKHHASPLDHTVGQHDARTGRRVVVVGGTGFIGRHLGPMLAAAGDAEPWYLLHRGQPDWIGSAGIGHAAVDLADEESLHVALRPGDVVVNLLRPDGTGWFAEATQRLLRSCAAAGVARYVHVSSIDVFGANPDDVLTPGSAAMPRTPYELEHARAEQMALSAQGIAQVTVLRLGAVFGEGGRNVLALAQAARSGPWWQLAARRLLNGQRRMHLVSVARACALLRSLCAEVPGLRTRELLVLTDDDDEHNQFAWVQDTLMALNARQPVSAVPSLPPAMLTLALRLRGLSNTNPMRRLRCERLAELGLARTPPFPDELIRYAGQLARGDADESGASR